MPTNITTIRGAGLLILYSALMAVLLMGLWLPVERSSNQLLYFPYTRGF